MSASAPGPFAGWEAGPAAPRLAAGEVDLWGIALDEAAAAGAEALFAVLSEDERARADRLAFEHHRRRWVVARAALRTVLARYAGCAPGALRFEVGEHGKPALAPGSPGAGAVAFNLSHTADAGLLAVTAGAEVGVDLERVRADLDALALAARWFSAVEVEAWRGLPETVRLAAFFRCWTGKEAWLKAVGEGVQGGLGRFDIAFCPGETLRLLRTRPDPAEAARWTLREVEVAPTHAAALAVAGAPRLVRRFVAGR